MGEFRQPKREEASKEALAERPQVFQPQRRPSQRKSDASEFSESLCLGTHSRRSAGTQKRKVTMAMKCLRPVIRSDSEQFMLGVEDLVRETVMLASLAHPHIVTLHGLASGRVGDGYFILIDKLKDTLDNCIRKWSRWKKFSDKTWPSSPSQIKVTCAIADALAYLHSKDIAFRDLKPANVGFDTAGVLKLFDFGFAIHNPPPGGGGKSETKDAASYLLYDKCGTARYMAPEVYFEKPYRGLPADVYSFGILMWEICSLKKPFDKVKSAEEFHETVFEKDARPELPEQWPHVITEVISQCWLTCPLKRPTIDRVKTKLAAYACELALKKDGGRDHKSSKHRKRLTM